MLYRAPRGEYSMRKTVAAFAIGALLAAGPAASIAQVRTIDPNTAVDSDLHQSQSPRDQTQAPPSAYQNQSAAPAYQDQSAPPAYQDSSAPPYQDSSAPPPEQNTNVTQGPYTGAPAGAPVGPGPGGAESTRQQADDAAGRGDTFSQSEVLSAAEGTFGKGAAGLAGILERTLKEQGRPNAYITGSEASGAIAIGLRYGRGKLFHKVEGERTVFWQGPSLGFDLGGDGSKVFVLVYNLYDTEEIYKRFPAAEGRLYFVGGFAATYLRAGNVVLIPIRLGVGWRQGVNIGYMKFTHKSRWFPF
jgi:hypothetical protein